MATGITITLAVPTNDEYWTHRNDEADSGWMARAIDAYEERVAAAVCDAFPDATVSTRRVPEVFSRNNQTRVSVQLSDTLPQSPSEEYDVELRVTDRVQEIEQSIDVTDVK